MSLFAAALLPDRALVVCDTAAYTMDGPRGDTTKVLPLPHATMVLGGRGAFEPLTDAWRTLLLHHPPQHLGDLERDGADIFAEAFEAYLTDAAARGLDLETQGGIGIADADAILEAFAVGFDPDKKAFAGLIFSSLHDFTPVRIAAPNCLAAPVPSDFAFPSNAPTMADVIACSRAQWRESVEWSREHLGFDGCGGEIVTIELTQGAMEIRDAGAYEEAKRQPEPDMAGLSRQRRRALKRQQRKEA